MLKSFFAMTDKGPYFNINQDGFISSVEHGLFGVIDSFGGTGIGDVLTKNLKLHIENVFQESSKDQDKTLKYFFDQHRTIECNFLVNAILNFHEKLSLENESKSIHLRSGASATFIVNNSNFLTIVSVGNTSSILVRNSKAEKIILEDSTFAFESNSSNSSPKSAIGLFSPLFPSIREFRIQNGDKVLMMTKGAVCGIALEELVLLAQEKKPKDSLVKIFNTSNQNGNRDNQTAILLQF